MINLFSHASILLKNRTLSCKSCGDWRGAKKHNSEMMSDVTTVVQTTFPFFTVISY